MRKLAILLLTGYKATFSRWKGKRCIYTPSCSVYAMEAYAEYGFFAATLLTAKRLLRCAPWGKGGFDPLPANLRGSMKMFV